MISAVVLAAGKAQRMGKPKLFSPWRGKAVLQWVLESVLATRINEVICVVGDLKAARAHTSLADERLCWLVYDQEHLGQSASIIAGLWAIDRRSTGALIVQGDRPTPDSALIDALIGRAEQVSARIIAPSLHGEVTSPLLFRREIFPELLKLKGDRGGRALIKKYPGQVEVLHWDERIGSAEIEKKKHPERLKRRA
jgi:molybdenum cofactor cytidylyltransferase